MKQLSVHRPFFILWLAITALLAGCSTVTVDHDRGASFAGQNTYAIMPHGEDQGYLSLDASRIERSLVRELDARGYQRVALEEADILVRYDIVEEIRNQSSGFSYGFGFGRNNLGLGLATAPDSRQIKEGKLVVEFVTPEERRAIWRGAGRRNLTEGMSSERRERLIDSLITEMLAKYPPG
ncbi:DUF4136 domain-containing protein [Isoalcanivorax indicus]|uniref:DUF4136 domain-containing protein n=1 Tax=Isoalcanivorax indicus TaxID=2202653 RepID=UPI000DBA6867|nr:DUF4136 domain-containing protein [Isoalcanivorax indicus]